MEAPSRPSRTGPPTATEHQIVVVPRDETCPRRVFAQIQFKQKARSSFFTLILCCGDSILGLLG